MFCIFLYIIVTSWMTDVKCQNLILHERRMVKDSKAKAITEKKRKMWIFFPIYYLTASVLLSFYICLLIKPSSFLYKICHLTVLAKRNLQFYITQREREHKGGFCSHLLSLRRQFICHLIMTNPHSSFLPLFSLSLSVLPSLSTLCIFSLPFVKLSTPNPISWQSVFSTPHFSLGNVWKCWVAYSPLVICPKYFCALPFGDSFVPATPRNSTSLPLTAIHTLTFN